MIHVYGTSHVSEESFELVDEKLEQYDPDYVAIELDLSRLEGMLSDREATGGPLFMRFFKKIQDRIGLQTGVMPGAEMIYAYRKAVSESRDVVLIDQDIRVTVRRLRKVPKKEKMWVFLSLLRGFFMKDSFDVSSIPEDNMLHEILLEFKKRFPNLYRVLVIERNRVMAQSLTQLQRDNPESDIVAFVGAAHVEDLENQLDSILDNE